MALPRVGSLGKHLRPFLLIQMVLITGTLLFIYRTKLVSRPLRALDRSAPQASLPAGTVHGCREFSSCPFRLTCGEYLMKAASQEDPDDRRRPPPAFRLKLKGVSVCLLTETLDKVTRALGRAGLDFFFHSGTLLGSWRHHGRIPWDDDVDLSLSSRHKARVEAILKHLPGCSYKKFGKNKHWKVFPKAGLIPTAQKRSLKPWRWPFVDIFFYKENATHLIDLEARGFPELVLRKDLVYPTSSRPFNGLMLPFPGKALPVLKHLFSKLNMCKTGSFNHMTEKWQRSVGLPCEQLSPFYPWVSRRPVYEEDTSDSDQDDEESVKDRSKVIGCNETLEFQGQVLSWFLAKDMDCL